MRRSVLSILTAVTMLPVLVATIILHGVNYYGGEIFDYQVFHNRLYNMTAHKYALPDVNVTPAWWLGISLSVFSVQLLWTLYTTFSVCYNERLASSASGQLYNAANMSSIAWMFLYDNEQLVASAVVANVAVVLCALAALAQAIHMVRAAEEALFSAVERGMTSVLVLNGQATYACWLGFVSQFNVGQALAYAHPSDPLLASYVVLTLLAVGSLLFAVVSLCLRTYHIYVWTPFIVPLLFLAATTVNNFDWALNICTFKLIELIALAFINAGCVLMHIFYCSTSARPQVFDSGYMIF